MCWYARRDAIGCDNGRRKRSRFSAGTPASRLMAHVARGAGAAPRIAVSAALAGVICATTAACRSSSEGQQDLSPWHGASITDLNAINTRDTGQWHVLRMNAREGVLSMRVRADNPSEAPHIAAKLVQANKNQGFRDIEIAVIGPEDAENAAPRAQASLLGGATGSASSPPASRH